MRLVCVCACVCVCMLHVGCSMVVSDKFLPAFSVLGGSLCPWAEVVWVVLFVLGQRLVGKVALMLGVSCSCVVLLTVSCLR